MAEELKALTSLRFFAAMMIVTLHAKLYFPGEWQNWAPGTLVHGVSFFFVLSGFILTHVYLSQPFPGYREFIIRRIGRLWPVHVFSAAILVATLLFSLPLIRADSITFDGEGVWSRWFALPLNLAMLQAWSPFFAHSFSWNSPSWSISTEFAFYLMFPFLLHDIEKTWHYKLLASGVLVLLILIGMSLFRLPIDSDIREISRGSLVINPLFRGFEFCLGMATCVLWRRHILPAKKSAAWWTRLEFAVSAFAIVWLASPAIPLLTHAPFGSEWIGNSGSCFVFALVIATLARGKGYLSRALSCRLFVFGGEISYSIYMLHHIGMKIAFSHNYLYPDRVVLLIIAASVASYLLIERPGRMLAARLARRRSSKDDRRVLRRVVVTAQVGRQRHLELAPPIADQESTAA
jgi:peptidoglycan/LPS O-acetylase OafA/YrhL